MLKQMMKLWMLSTIFLSSCGSNDLEESVDFNQKSVIIVLKDSEDGRRYINEEKSYCLKRRYRYSIDYIGPISKGEKLPLLKCHKIIGNSPLNYKKKIDWLEAIRLEASQWFED